MHESPRQVLRYHLLHETVTSLAAETNRMFRSVIPDKLISVHDPISKREHKALTFWFEAFKALRKHPLAHRAFTKYVNSVEFIRPQGGEDAVWVSDHAAMKLATKQAGYSGHHMLKGLVHEIGHAVEDNIKINQAVWGRPPFALNYNGTPGEDFAESFMLYNLDPEFMEHTTPVKFREMRQVERMI